MSRHVFPSSATPKCSNYAIKRNYSCGFHFWDQRLECDRERWYNGSPGKQGLHSELLIQVRMLIDCLVSFSACPKKINIAILNLIVRRKPTNYLIQFPTQCRKSSHTMSTEAWYKSLLTKYLTQNLPPPWYFCRTQCMLFPLNFWLSNEFLSFCVTGYI